jgi:hypothetical protein
MERAMMKQKRIFYHRKRKRKFSLYDFCLKGLSHQIVNAWKWFQSKALGYDILLQIFKKLNSLFSFKWAKVLKHTTPNTFHFSFLLEHE